MEDDDPLARSIADWQLKHRIADGDPMIAALDLVRVYLRHARHGGNETDDAPPRFDDFRATIELLERRSKSFINQASDLVAELRRFGGNVEKLNRVRIATALVLMTFAALIGVLVGRSL